MSTCKEHIYMSCFCLSLYFSPVWLQHSPFLPELPVLLSVLSEFLSYLYIMILYMNFKTDNALFSLSSFSFQGPVIQSLSRRCGGFLKRLNLQGCQSIEDDALRYVMSFIWYLSLQNLRKICEQNTLNFSLRATFLKYGASKKSKLERKIIS